MKKLLSIVFILCSALSITTTNAADLKQGIYELNRGEFKAAIAEFEPLVEEGYSPAQYHMGLIYLNGWGVRKDAQKAFDFFTLAAEQNNPDAQFELSLMYTSGDVVKKDPKMAFELTQKAADQNLASAIFNLGVMYANGEGTYKDNTKAARLYEQAAKLNYALAQFNLALMYFDGKGIEKSIEQSYIWNTIASRNGYGPAEKSRILDERQLPTETIEKARDKANTLYNNLIAQAELRNKLSNGT